MIALALILAITAAPDSVRAARAPPPPPPQGYLRTEPIEVLLQSFRGRVLIDVAGAVSDARVGAVLSEGTAIETAADAFARLELPDGTHIVVPSNSRLRLDRMRRVILTGALERAVTLERGRVESDVTPMSNPASRYIISTPIAVSSVRGTVFRAAYDNKTATGSSGVLRGAVAVAVAVSGSGKAKGKEVKPNAGEGVTASNEGVSDVKNLLPAPQLVRADYPQTEADVGLNLAPVTGANAYRVRVYADVALTNPLRELTVSEPHAVLDDVPDGIYYLSITAIATDGLEGKPGVYPMMRLRMGLKLDPVKMDRTPAGARAVFTWKDLGDSPASYRFTLHRGDAFGPLLIDRLQSDKPEYTVTALAPGAYTWIVQATRVLDGRKVEDYSDPQPFLVSSPGP